MSATRTHHLGVVSLVATVGLLILGLGGLMIASANAKSTALPGLERIVAKSPSSSSDYKYVTARCTPGKRLIGTGGAIGGGAGHVEMDDIAPRAASDGGPPASVRVYAYETDSYAGNWTVTAYAICAQLGDDPKLQWRQWSSARNSAQERDANVECVGAGRVLGMGYHVEGGLGEVVTNRLEPENVTSPRNVAVFSIESDQYSQSWRVTVHALCGDPTNVPGLERVQMVSGGEDVNTKSVTAKCPSTKKLVGTGAKIDLGVDDPGEQHDYVINSIVPFDSSVTVTASEEDPVSSQWYVVAYAICASP